ncbi:MAG TPA: PilT/PilU family type 4a pilus ATPase [Verrucomicrobiae bacterium]|jgi:twitching motility protein PilT|nr:PilT/PilU family type 4a pilus ATPase [Verrucomicrobiae bacterium]
MNKEELDKLLAAMIEFADGISDLLFVAGRPMQVETQGELKPFVHELAESALTSERIEGMANIIINNNPRLLQDLKEHGSCDCGYTLKNACRFRVNIYFQNGNYAMVLRHLKPLIPTFDTLKLGPTFAEIIKEKNGIIFVTGGTGMGKTTTIAAMLNEINKTRNIHILTLEDPIEFVLSPIKSTFSQRELGRDFYSFHKGMRAAMREAPKIIFIGEIRDRETMEIVLNAGETGHLVFSTLHTTSAAMTVNRIIGMFGTDEEAQMRERLAGSMRYVISQRLVPTIAGGRLLVTEMMGSNLRTREAILLGENEGRRLDDIIEAGTIYGWHSFEQSLFKAYEQDLITDETALLYCSNKMKMIQRIDALSLQKPRKSATTTSTFADLKMQEEEKHRDKFRR